MPLSSLFLCCFIGGIWYQYNIISISFFISLYLSYIYHHGRMWLPCCPGLEETSGEGYCHQFHSYPYLNKQYNPFYFLSWGKNELQILHWFSLSSQKIAHSQRRLDDTHLNSDALTYTHRCADKFSKVCSAHFFCWCDKGNSNLFWPTSSPQHNIVNKSASCTFLYVSCRIVTFEQKYLSFKLLRVGVLQSSSVGEFPIGSNG